MQGLHAPANSNPWGKLKQVRGPPWPDFSKIEYPDLPATRPESSPPAPVDWNSTIIEAPVPGVIEVGERNPNIELAVEPTSPGGVVYWSGHQDCRPMAPVLLIDYEPKKRPRNSVSW